MITATVATLLGLAVVALVILWRELEILATSVRNFSRSMGNLQLYATANPMLRMTRTANAQIQLLAGRVYHLSEQALLPTNQALSLPSGILGAPDVEHFAMQLLPKIIERFLCRTALVLISCPNESKPIIVSSGSQMGPVQDLVFNLFATNTLGFGKQSAQNGDLLDAFGYGDSLTHPITINTDDGAIKGALWLGYGRSTPPSILEEKWAKEIADALGVHFSAFTVVNKLSDQHNNHTGSSSSQFIAHLSHDLRAPLNNIKAVLHLLDLQVVNEEERELLQVATKNCGQLGNLVGNVLDIYRHEQRALVPCMQSCDLGQLVKDIADSFSPTFRSKKIDFSISVPERSYYSIVDINQIRRACGNLIQNSLKYTPSGGTVSVSISEKPRGQARIMVKDTGAGIEAIDLKHIFTPFFRANPDSAEGAGLGLPLTKMLVEQNRGTIQVTSSKGKGSSFAISIPLTGQELSAKNPEVLLVDDDEESATSLARILATAGIDSYVCHSIEQAKAALGIMAPQIIVSDYRLRDGTVEDLLSEIEYTNTPSTVIILSGLPRNGLRCRDEEVLAFVKPLEPTALVELIKNRLADDSPSTDA